MKKSNFDNDDNYIFVIGVAITITLSLSILDNIIVNNLVIDTLVEGEMPIAILGFALAVFICCLVCVLLAMFCFGCFAASSVCFCE